MTQKGSEAATPGKEPGELLHATCVALDGAAGPIGVLLRGPSGAGKSELALRLIEQGWRLVADDQCRLAAEAGRLVARAPGALAGKIEARGLGILEMAHLPEAPLALLVDLVPPETVERLPEPERAVLLGIALPRLSLAASDLSAPLKLRLALEEAAPAPARKAATAPAPRPEGARRIVLVTGLSGAGRSTALNVLEDLGYEVIDNLPLGLVEQALADEAGGEEGGPVALGIDIRTRHFAVQPFLELLDRLQADPRLSVRLIFLTCDEEVLRRRFTETRRRHPLAQDRPLLDGIVAERRLVFPLRERADAVIDTSALTPGELRRELAGDFAPEAGAGLSLVVISFSYRLGLPRSADLVFDARFLENPHYDPALRPLTGKDAAVAERVRADPGFEAFYGRLKALVLPLIPRYEAEGKAYLTLAFGCTGGRHRSVMLAEAFAAELRASGRKVTLVHRDLDRDGPRPGSDEESSDPHGNLKGAKEADMAYKPGLSGGRDDR